MFRHELVLAVFASFRVGGGEDDAKGVCLRGTSEDLCFGDL